VLSRHTVARNGWAPSVAAASIVLAGGFGVLLAFHRFGGPPPGVPGLFAFASATWGDALALPVMTGSLVHIVSRLPATRRDLPRAAVAGGVTGLLGAGIEVQQLLDDHPRPNWTFPTAHQFTTAGWYHAGFLTVLAAAAGFLWMLALLRLARHGRTPEVVAVVVALVSALSFGALLAVDLAPHPAGTSVAAATAGASATILVVATGSSLVALARRI
jgi:hypothetical protein